MPRIRPRLVRVSSRIGFLLPVHLLLVSLLLELLGLVHQSLLHLAHPLLSRPPLRRLLTRQRAVPIQLALLPPVHPRPTSRFRRSPPYHKIPRHRNLSRPAANPRHSPSAPQLQLLPQPRDQALPQHRCPRHQQRRQPAAAERADKSQVNLNAHRAQPTSRHHPGPRR